MSTETGAQEIRRVGIATDHAGWPLKAGLVLLLEDQGCEVVDFGAHTLDAADDYDWVALEGTRSYRITGRRGNESYLGFCVYGMTPDGAASIVANGMEDCFTPKARPWRRSETV